MRMTLWVLVVTILLLCLTEAGAVVIWESGKLQRYTPFKYKAGPHIFDIAQDQRGCFISPMIVECWNSTASHGA